MRKGKIYIFRVDMNKPLTVYFLSPPTDVYSETHICSVWYACVCVQLKRTSEVTQLLSLYVTLISIVTQLLSLYVTLTSVVTQL